MSFSPDLNPPAIMQTSVCTAAPAICSAVATIADIRAIQNWQDRAQEFATIREYGDNWDGRGSDAPTPAALRAAAVFMAICKNSAPDNPPARIALSPSGYLTAEWLDGGALRRAEVMELESNEVEWMMAVPGHPTEFLTTPLVEETRPETKQVQTWQPAQVAEGALALAYAR